MNTKNHKHRFALNLFSAHPETSGDSEKDCLTDDPPADPAVEVERLHVHIKKDLSGQLLEAAYMRKRDRNIKPEKATKRAIVEEALEAYFDSCNQALEIDHPQQ